MDGNHGMDGRAPVHPHREEELSDSQDSEDLSESFDEDDDDEALPEDQIQEHSPDNRFSRVYSSH